jgi:hypothetical protein
MTMPEYKYFWQRRGFWRALARLAVAFAVAFSIPVIIVGGILLHDRWSEYRQRLTFDSASWREQTLVNSRYPVRVRMVADLLHRHELQGMSKRRVVELLGPPDVPSFTGYDLAYWLGLERGPFASDS